jgi:hypothetical protein
MGVPIGCPSPARAPRRHHDHVLIVVGWSRREREAHAVSWRRHLVRQQADEQADGHTALDTVAAVVQNGRKACRGTGSRKNLKTGMPTIWEPAAHAFGTAAREHGNRCQAESRDGLVREIDDFLLLGRAVGAPQQTAAMAAVSAVPLPRREGGAGDRLAHVYGRAARADKRRKSMVGVSPLWLRAELADSVLSFLETLVHGIL